MVSKEHDVKKVVRVGLFGVGTVGSGVATVLTENAEIICQRCTEIQLTHIASRSKEKIQALVDKLGLKDVTISDDWKTLLEDDSLDILVEVAGGIPVAKEFITEALTRGKSVVTANKDLMASYGSELLQLAEDNHTDLFFEASVAGGIPIIQALKESLVANEFTQIMGILNGTTNYILTAMNQKGQDFQVALDQATELGYAEADPTDDVENFDAGRKIAILASIAFNSRVKDSDVPVEGITKITDWDITYAKEFGYTIKSVGVAKCENGEIEVRVHPAMIPNEHPLASVNDAFNGVFVEGNALGKAMFYGRGAGSLPTGSAVVGDIVNAARNIIHDCRSRWGCTCYLDLKIKPVEETSSKYYVRITAYDRPGVFAAITKILGGKNVSLDAVMQKRRVSEDMAEIVMITHKVKHADLMAAMDEIGKLDCVPEIKSIIRVEENDA